MKKPMLWMLAFAAASAGALFGRNIAGSWQSPNPMLGNGQLLRDARMLARASDRITIGVGSTELSSLQDCMALRRIVMLSCVPRPGPPIHAALTSAPPENSVRPGLSRSAASSHWIQRRAQGKAARRFGLIADSHSMQTPKLPS